MYRDYSPRSDDMSYSYYQNGPGWGTSQYQFQPPPVPSWQPQPSWGGMDYYRAHAPSPDPMIYNAAWDRVRNYSGTGGLAMGVGLHEARHWHRRTYGGMSQINMMLPEEIGHAAAYEAYRTWIHNSSLYEPISADDYRQREALVGIAIAEANRIWQYSERRHDRYSLQAASEAAAATASIIFNQASVDYDERNSPDPMYAYDEQYYPRRSRRSRRSHSFNSGRPVVTMAPSYSGSVYGGGQPIPITNSVGGYGAPPMAGSYAISTSPYSGTVYGGGGGFAPSGAGTVVISQPSTSGHHRHRSHSRSRYGRRHSTSEFYYPPGSNMPMSVAGSYRY